MDNKDTPIPVEQNASTPGVNNEKDPGTSSMPPHEELGSTHAMNTEAGTHERVEPGSISPKKTHEICHSYLAESKAIPVAPWSKEDLPKGAYATLKAPYLTGGDADHLTGPELIAGIYINIPRSGKIWAGDQLKITWGYNTFYCTIPESASRAEPRLAQYLNSEELARYDDGVVFVSYEVVRGNKLIGISEKLKITLLGVRKSRTRSSQRKHAIRHRKLPF